MQILHTLRLTECANRILVQENGLRQTESEQVDEPFNTYYFSNVTHPVKDWINGVGTTQTETYPEKRNEGQSSQVRKKARFLI